MRIRTLMLGSIIGASVVCAFIFLDREQTYSRLLTTNRSESLGTDRPTEVDAKLYLSDLSCKTDQTRALNDAALAAGDGGLVHLPPGCILISPVATRPGQIWEGSGATFKNSAPYDNGVRDSGGTTLVYSRARGSAVTLIGSGAKLRNASLVDIYKGSPAEADSSGIQLGDMSHRLNPASQAVEHVRVFGFSTQVDIQSGEFWHISDFDLHNAIKFAVRVRNSYNPDSGDGRLIGGTIYNSPNNLSTVAIEYESSGGLKIGYTKILGGLSAFQQNFAPGVVTSDLVIDQTNSFEGQNGSSVVLGQRNGEGFSLLNNITIEPQIAGATAAAIEVRPGVRALRIGGLITNATYGIIISGGVGVALLPGTIMQNISDTALVLKGSLQDVDVSQSFLCILTCKKKFIDLRSEAEQRLGHEK